MRENEERHFIILTLTPYNGSASGVVVCIIPACTYLPNGSRRMTKPIKCEVSNLLPRIKKFVGLGWSWPGECLLTAGLIHRGPNFLPPQSTTHYIAARVLLEQNAWVMLHLPATRQSLLIPKGQHQHLRLVVFYFAPMPVRFRHGASMIVAPVLDC